ncbi:MAG: FHA domain-containing protein [Planctomycetes bacterium]|nr:FHA domain-containing protein [Planctomycetota bacterium]
MANLEIQFRGEEFSRALTGEALICGRQDDCDLVFADPRCSKKHCRIEFRAGAWRVVDLASANGTRVNGQTVSMVALGEGDRIEIGEVVLTFRAVGKAPEIGRGEDRRPSSRMPMLLAGAAALVAILVLVLRGGGGDEPRTEGVTSGNEDQAQGPESAGAEDLFLRGSLVTEWGAIRSARTASVTELVERARELAERARGLDEELATKAEDWALEQERAEILQQRRRLTEIREQAGLEAAEGRFAGGLDRLDELMAEFEARRLDRLLREAREAKLDLLTRARGVWEETAKAAEDRADAGDFAGARALLTAAAPGFGGTAFEAAAQSAVQLLELRARGQEVAVARPEGREEAPRPARVEKVDDGATSLIARAEKAAAARDWAGAAAAYREALKLAKGESLTRSWTRRAELLAALARLKDAVVVAVNDENRRVRSLHVGRLSARPYAADQDQIQLKFGGSGLVTWRWTEIPGETLLDLFQAGVDQPDDQLDYARAAIELGDEKRALAALVKAAGSSRSRKEEADRIFADWRGRDLPPGGFIVEEGGFFGPDEWSEIELRRSARKEAEKLVKARRAQLPDLVARVKAMGEPALEPLQVALEERYALVLAEAEASSFVSAPARYRGKLIEELDRRRAEALALIRDEKRYPYPYGPNQEEVEREVTALVERVRQVYQQPSVLLLETEKGLSEKLDELEEIVGLMLVPTSDRPSPSAFLDQVDRAIDLRNQGPSPSDQRYNEEVFIFNAEIKSSITDEEREVHRLTNEYRLMMGLRAVKIDEALVLAARGHSQEMKDLGYFSHTSPTKGRERPGDRCRLAGWGGAASENIAQGQRSPEGAVEGWIHSSGHHRNILGPRWTHLGCGKAKDGFYWTQNFGNGSSSAISREKIDPAERGAAEKKPDVPAGR